MSATNGSVDPAGGYYDENSIVTLTAIPDPGYAFINWTGDLSGSKNPLTLTMDNNKTVVANFGAVTQAPQVPAESTQIVVYPNPSNVGSFTVALQNLVGAVELRLTDMNGKTVFSERTQIHHAGHVQLPLNGLDKGTYILSVIAKDKVIYKKIVSN